MPVRIRPPIEHQTLWRYMSLEKLLSLLQRKCLYFTQMKQFRDPYEGAAPTGFQWQWTFEQSPVFVKSIKDEQIHDHLYVNCWHCNPGESAAMWAVYSRTSGVAVKTTLDRLQVALADATQDIEIAAVQYEAITSGFAAGSPWTIKRPSFAHEKEVRAVFRDPECGEAGIGIAVEVEALIERVHVSPESELWVEAVVIDVVAKYGLTATVKRSDLYTLR
jgi:hypothetical protein